MKPKTTVKITIDILMTIGLLLLMGYALVGEAAHEWIGAGMFVLFIVHPILNFKWTKNLGKGKYNRIRILQTAAAAAVFLAMIGLMVSGIMLSRHVFRFLGLRAGRSFVRTLHMACAYWGFVLMSFHLGLHWNRMMAMAGKLTKDSSMLRTIFLRCAGIVLAGYGVWAFLNRGIPSYMFLRTQFVFFNFEEPFIRFLLDYAGAMGLFVWIGHYLLYFTQKARKQVRKKENRTSFSS